MTRFATIRRMLAIMLLALWWGGFSFYAGRVVFIGHEVLRSKVRQGFITERVTTELNWLGLAMLAVVGWELFASSSFWRRRGAWMLQTPLPVERGTATQCSASCPAAHSRPATIQIGRAHV